MLFLLLIFYYSFKWAYYLRIILTIGVTNDNYAHIRRDNDTLTFSIGRLKKKKHKTETIQRILNAF